METDGLPNNIYSFRATNRFPLLSCRDMQSDRACVSPGGLLADMMDDSVHGFLATDSDGYSSPNKVKSSSRTKGQWTSDEDLQLIWCVRFQKAFLWPFSFDTSLFDTF